MITIGGTRQPSALYKGDTAISKVYRGSELIWESVKRYGGIPVQIDDVSYSYTNGTYDDYRQNSSAFIAQTIDLGVSQSRDITWGYVDSTETFSETIRLFNDLSQRSVDYWYSGYIGGKTLNWNCRYIVCSINKANASKFYIKNNTTGEYIIKGTDVT